LLPKRAPRAFEVLLKRCYNDDSKFLKKNGRKGNIYRIEREIYRKLKLREIYRKLKLLLLMAALYYSLLWQPCSLSWQPSMS